MVCVWVRGATCAVAVGAPSVISTLSSAEHRVSQARTREHGVHGGARRTGAPRGAPPRGTDGTAATVQLVRTRAAPRLCPYVGCMSKFN